MRNLRKTINDLAKKGLKSSHSIYNLSTFNVISHDLLISTFDIMILTLPVRRWGWGGGRIWDDLVFEHNSA